MADTATIPGSPVGFNCLLSSAGYGQRAARAIGISYGVDISSSEDEMRDSHVFYTLNVTESDFVLGLIFVSMAERLDFANWLSGWAKAVASNAQVSGYISVSIPVRDYSRRAVWEGGLVYGDAIGTTSYPLALQFIGASDPVSAVGKSSVVGDSFVETATRDTTDAPFFYPSYYVNGATGDSIYDNPSAPTEQQLNPLKQVLGSSFPILVGKAN